MEWVNKRMNERKSNGDRKEYGDMKVKRCNLILSI